MDTNMETIEEKLEKSLAELTKHFARIGLDLDFMQTIKPPDDDDPLVEIYVYLAIVQDNLRNLDDQNKRRIEELDQRVKERTAELEEQLQLTQKQSRAILELSTPVIEVWGEILILPLIGTIDTQRAQQIIDSLLDSIVKTQASVGIMDVTGVPVVDTKVASHLLKTIEAAKMLGTEVILTGVSPQNAQTLVKLGVALDKITTKSSLKAGLKLAFELTKRKVTEEI